MQAIRGKAYNPSRYKQIIDYSGLLYERGITPTDIDGALDFGGKLFIFIELKYGENQMPYGQRLFLERLCEGMTATKTAAVLVAHHWIEPEEEIDAAQCLVTEYLWGSKWIIPSNETTIKEAIEKIRNTL